MIKKIVFVISLLSNYFIFAQSNFRVIYGDTTNPKYADFIEPGFDQDLIGSVETIDLSNPKTLLKYVMNNEFSRLVTGNSLTGLGNYASISTADNTLSASFNLVGEHGVWDISVSGGSSDDITTLVSNSELNKGIGIGLAYHIRLNSDISINDSDIGKIADAEWSIRQKYRKEILGLENFEDDIDKQIESRNNEFIQNTKTKNAEINLLQKQIEYYSDEQNFKKAMAEIKKKYTDPKNESPFKEQQFEKDSIELIGKVEKLKKSIKIKVEELKALKIKHDYEEENYYRIVSQKHNDEEKEIKENREKLNDIKAKDVNFSWLTIGAESSYKEYSLFDETRAFDKQVYTENDLVSSFTLAYSKYSNKPSAQKLRAKRVKFFTLGVKGEIGNNISELDLYEVRTVDSITPTRTTLKKAEAYIGNFEDNELSINLFGDYYKFFGNKNNIGLHLRGTIDIGSFKPVTSCRVGAIIPFSKIDELKSNVNLELFVGLNDIFKNAKEGSIFSRNVLGIKATLPFNFKIL